MSSNKSQMIAAAAHKRQGYCITHNCFYIPTKTRIISLVPLSLVSIELSFHKVNLQSIDTTLLRVIEGELLESDSTWVRVTFCNYELWVKVWNMDRACFGCV